METYWRNVLAGATAGRGFMETNLQFAICSLQFAVMLLLLAAGLRGASADEGMWLFNNPPKKLLREKYGFTPSDARM